MPPHLQTKTQTAIQASALLGRVVGPIIASFAYNYAESVATADVTGPLRLLAGTCTHMGTPAVLGLNVINFFLCNATSVAFFMHPFYGLSWKAVGLDKDVLV